MGLQKLIKNSIGNLLDYGRCPVTNNTYWNADLVSVPYSNDSGVLISARALDELPKEQIAQIVFKKSGRMSTLSSRYDLEEITAKIPGGCKHILIH